jgi:hypothetical protein
VKNFRAEELNDRIMEENHTCVFYCGHRSTEASGWRFCPGKLRGTLSHVWIQIVIWKAMLVHSSWIGQGHDVVGPERKLNEGNCQ